METHFPGCIPLSNDSTADGNDSNETHELVPIHLDNDRVKWAIDSFDPYKAAGPDGIIPADLQHNVDTIVPWLIQIYRACLYWSYIPDSWTRCIVVFIPKAGKACHSKPKDFRPISLESFLLKTLERIIDLHLRTSIDSKLLSNSQHAYNKGRSVETALHSLVGSIEKSLEYGEYTLVAFLDIEGAFNNIKPESIVSALTDLGVDNSIIEFIWRLLTRRVIRSTMGASTVCKVACRGTPQGGVLSPLLWNLTINKLLMELDSMMFTTVAYADDVAVAVSGKFLSTLSERLESALNTLSSWCADCGLSANPSKTELVLFTRKYKIPNFTLPKLSGVELVRSDSAKYLGIILDSKLSWKLNTDSRASKASIALYSCRRAIGKTWGLSPSSVTWLFNIVVKPILSYGAIVWWTTLSTKERQNSLNSVLRSSALLITGALRNTPSKALFVMLHWLPVELMIKQVAINSAIRLSLTESWMSSNIGHANVLENYDLPDLTDYCAPIPFPDRGFSVNISGGSLLEDEDRLDVFTDGSKSGNGVGCGVYIPLLGKKLSYKLPSDCSVLQAELTAIKRATYWLRYYRVYNRDIRLCIDSKAAIKILSDVYMTSPLTRECRASLNEMARHCAVELFWVPSHNNIHGNTVADKLAKQGSLLAEEETDLFTGLPLNFCKLMVKQELYRSAQALWTKEEKCKIARQTWPLFDERKSSKLVCLSRHKLRVLTAVLTGHCTFGLHAQRMKIHFNDYCRSCHDIEEEETVEHLLCHCPALSDIRAQHLGAGYLHDLSDISNVELTKVYSFANASGWLGTES